MTPTNDRNTQESRTRANEPASYEDSSWMAMAEDGARRLADNLTIQVREHPVRTLALAGAAGFLLASVARPRLIPALVRSSVGVAAAMALRKLSQNAMHDFGGVGEAE
jgi:hypothetical protein